MQPRFIFFIFPSEKHVFQRGNAQKTGFSPLKWGFSRGETTFFSGKTPFFPRENGLFSCISREENVKMQTGLQGFHLAAEEICMGMQTSFQQILEEKIRMQNPPGAAPGESFPDRDHAQDPAHLAYLLGSLQVSYFRPTAAKIYPAPPTPPPRPHVLNEAQIKALSFFTLHGVTLSPAFTRRELKKAFRSLALRLHPDTNKGTSGPFIELKQMYESLSVLFN
jgi:hypothetical protein